MNNPFRKNHARVLSVVWGEEKVPLPIEERMLNLLEHHDVCVMREYDVWGFEDPANECEFIISSINGRIELVQVYVNVFGPKIIASRDDLAVCFAAHYGQLDVVKFLAKNGADLTARDNLAICWAAANGQLDMVKWLFKNGADITVSGNTPVRWAAMCGHFKVVEYLASVQKKRRKTGE